MRAAAATKAHLVSPLEDCEVVVEGQDERPVLILLSSLIPAMSCGWGGHASITRASAGRNRALMATFGKACPFPARHLHFSIILTTTFPGGMEGSDKHRRGAPKVCEKEAFCTVLSGPIRDQWEKSGGKKEGAYCRG